MDSKDSKGDYPKGYAFVQFLHEESVDYASSLMNGIKLYGKRLRVAPAGQDRATPKQESPMSVHSRMPNLHSSNGTNSSLTSLEGTSPRPSVLSTPPSLSTPVLSHQPIGPGYVPLNDHSPSVDGHHSLATQHHTNPRLHETRAHATDHPPWLRDETRRNLSHYHERHIHQGSDQGWRTHVPADPHDRPSQTASYNTGLLDGRFHPASFNDEHVYDRSPHNTYHQHNHEVSGNSQFFHNRRYSQDSYSSSFRNKKRYSLH